MRIKLTAKLKSLTAFSLLAAYPPPVMWIGWGQQTMRGKYEKRL